MGKGRVKELRMNTYTLQSSKKITNKDLLYSIRNSAQYYIKTSMGKEFEKEQILIRN